MRVVYLHLLAVLLIAGQAITWAQVAGKDFPIAAQDDERDKRAVDFGQFVRNLLLKSATASNAKANISRNLANVKATAAAPRRRTTTTTTTTTTPVPLFFNKGPFKFPFDLSGPINNKFNYNKGAGFINFDYNDYGGQPPVRPGRRRRPTTTTTTTTTSTTRAPATTPARRRPIPRRPYGLLSKQKVPYYDYYDEYDYNYDDTDASNNTPAPAPAPPAPRPQRPPTANRARAQGRVPQLRNRLIYQFRQPDDTSINNAADAPTADNNNNYNNNDNNEASPAANNNSNNDETSANTNDYTDDVYDDVDVNAGPDNNPPTNTNQDYNDSSDNANTNNNPNSNNDNANTAVAAPAPLPPPNNFNFNNGFPNFQGQFPNAEANFNGPSGFGNFGPPGGFPYNAYNDFNLQYQPSSQVGYSVQHN